MTLGLHGAQANRASQRSIETLKSMVAKIIRQRRQDMQEQGEGEAGPAQDLLSLLIAARDDEAGKLSDQELRVCCECCEAVDRVLALLVQSV